MATQTVRAALTSAALKGVKEFLNTDAAKASLGRDAKSFLVSPTQFVVRYTDPFEGRVEINIGVL